MKNIWLLLCWFCFFSAGFVMQAEGQVNRMEETRNGRMFFVFKSEKGDSTVTASSNQLMCIFNFDESGIKLMANLSTFQSAHPRLDSLLKTIEPPHFQFKANMAMTRLNFDQGSHVKFPLEGTLDFNQISRFVRMEADLYEVSRSNRVRAQLRLRKRLFLEEMGLREALPAFNNEFYIELYQPLLKPERFSNL